ncbi:MAG: hypothetical protein KA715_11835 [Xanthomonadaceae bacterium]|nr:hypothetical protein [Xanthomonadaceae bacterium]
MRAYLTYTLPALMFIVLGTQAFAKSPEKPNPFNQSCARKLIEYKYQLMVGGSEPLIFLADGNTVPLSRAFEKEGLMYSDIEEWFPHVNAEKFKQKLAIQLDREFKEKKVGPTSKWLMEFHKKYRDVDTFKYESRDPGVSPSEILALLTKDPKINPFELISMDGKDALFYDRVLTFDDLQTEINSALLPFPPFVTVGDDEGSYEVRSRTGTADLRAYNRERETLEQYLEGMIGHQHLVHAWPEDQMARTVMAPKYIEMIDATTWYLFWRQAKRDDQEVESILSHPFLGVYTRNSLKKLHEAVVKNDAKNFKNKYRFLGARNLPGSPTTPGQVGKQLPDLETRSGNKGIKREFVEDILISRISSGDYDGLRNFDSYDFNMDIPLHKMVEKYLRPHEVAWIQRLEEIWEPLKYKKDIRSHNHIRNKVIAPLFAWENRLNLGAKKELLDNAREKFAKSLSEIARDYLNEYQTWKSPYDKGEGQKYLFSDLETAVYKFSVHVRLDQDFERYLKPVLKDKIPNIIVKTGGMIDVNKVDLGIEFSFRSPKIFDSREEANKFISQAAENLKNYFGGGSIEKLEDSGHGHGLSLRYIVTDLQGRKWRVEWDGIRRSYRNGKAYHLRGGHIEIPTPKFAPQNTDEIEKLYAAMRSIEALPKASAGGGHTNIDLAPLFAMGDKLGTEKFLNLLRYFESNREMVSFLWQHPARERTSIPVELGLNDIRRLNEFQGDWKSLGAMLYSIKYFNTFVSRKPSYTQLNAVGLMVEEAPDEYREGIDIKNPETEWFPSFGGKAGDRVEFRLFDAPENEVLAALQIKYVRAMINYVWNTNSQIKLQTLYHPEHRTLWEKDPKIFIADVKKHFRQLGLNFEEFKPLIVHSWHKQQYERRKDWRAERRFGKFKRRKITVEEMRKD